MKREDAIKEFQRKKFGKCMICEHAINGNYCTIRREPMNNSLLGDLITIKFCKFYEKEED